MEYQYNGEAKRQSQLQSVGYGNWLATGRVGPQHGFGTARRIEQISEQALKLNEGTVCTSLLRLQQQGWISSEWGVSENNRRARFYSITKRGQKQLAIETANWETIRGLSRAFCGWRDNSDYA
jgi:PadR family transcriptional regulator, regulatory protein PadR